ncbi:ATP-dependent RNA helicase [Streptomyces chilikensis]|uniref:ATP-dependent RNA helicase n=1 Tax=Streptomyces chilikensis TaxID=1194079 RepID=UPI001409649D|nr:ATP-dependent helicase C-terminal domain-containing protein [Streptomyces chilikensis]
MRDAALELPVRSALPPLEEALDGHGAAVLCAPPGTGKTTLVPLALAGLTGPAGGPDRGRVIVAEPRRIAARAAARRMAWLLGESVGGTVGYRVRGDRAVSSRTRVEVVTTGVLLQRLQRDQELAGVGTVVLDECHERHLDADTAAAFLLDVRETLRPDLRLVAASATTDAGGWARLLGGAPVVEAHGTAHPVETVWAPPPRPVRPPHGTRVDPALLAHVASVVRRALAERDGDVLCFLPGVGEIARVAGALDGLRALGVDVLQVHGRAPAAVQDAVLSPGGRRRVVLATSVAESSLTVPGVRVVVDSGLARDLAAAWRSARGGGGRAAAESGGGYAARWRAEARRLRSLAGDAAGEAGPVRLRTDDQVAGAVAALAFPERVGRVEGGSCLMAGGTRAEVPEGSPLRAASWLAVAVADRPVGQGHARIRLAAVVDEEVARRAAAPLLAEGEEVRWADGDVVARRVERLGAVELTVRPLRDAEPARIRAALLDGLRREGLGLLRWSRDAEVLRQRLAFLRGRLGDPWPDVSDEALLARAREWLEPELGRARRRADLGRIDAGQGLVRLLPWASGEGARLDELAPERLEVPSGSRIRVDYADPERPVLAVKLQEMFGSAGSPSVAGVPVVVHLLSPAGRPVAVTADLASFWREGYRGVRAELRGRYPRHPWPEDPATAVPTRHTNARLRREGG